MATKKSARRKPATRRKTAKVARLASDKVRAYLAERSLSDYWLDQELIEARGFLPGCRNAVLDLGLRDIAASTKAGAETLKAFGFKPARIRQIRDAIEAADGTPALGLLWDNDLQVKLPPAADPEEKYLFAHDRVMKVGLPVVIFPAAVAHLAKHGANVAPVFVEGMLTGIAYFLVWDALPARHLQKRFAPLIMNSCTGWAIPKLGTPRPEVAKLLTGRKHIATAFDGDVVSNVNVGSAAAKLVHYAERAGVERFTHYIPPDGQGVDDLFATHARAGATKPAQLAEALQEYAKSELPRNPLREMLETVYLSADAPDALYYEIDEEGAVVMTCNQRKLGAVYVTPVGSGKSKTTLANAYLKSTEKRLVEVVYNPAEPAGLSPEPVGKKRNRYRLNMWRGFTYPAATKRSREGETLLKKHAPMVKRWGEHVRGVIAAGDGAFAARLHQVIAHIRREPGTKITSGFVLMGAQGAGKSFFLEAIAAMTGPHANAELDEEDLFGAWREELARGLVFGGCAEAYGLVTARHANEIKSYVTSYELSLRRKHRDRVKVINVTRWFFLTNKRDFAIRLEPDDRRWNVSTVDGARPNENPEAWFSPMKGLGLQDPNTEMIEALAYWYDTRVSLDSFDPHARPLDTKTRRAQIAETIEADESVYVAFLRELLSPSRRVADDPRDFNDRRSIHLGDEVRELLHEWEKKPVKIPTTRLYAACTTFIENHEGGKPPKPHTIDRKLSRAVEELFHQPSRNRVAVGSGVGAKRLRAFTFPPRPEAMSRLEARHGRLM